MLMPDESPDVSVLTSMVLADSVPEMFSESLSWMPEESSDSMMLTLSVSVAQAEAADCPETPNARLDSVSVLSATTEPVILPIAMRQEPLFEVFIEMYGMHTGVRYSTPV